MAITTFAAQQLQAKIISFVTTWPRATFGPAHVILDDLNFSEESFDWCLDLIRSALEKRDSFVYPSPFARKEDLEFLEAVNWYKSVPTLELQATEKFLKHLRDTLYKSE